MKSKRIAEQLNKLSTLEEKKQLLFSQHDKEFFRKVQKRERGERAIDQNFLDALNAEMRLWVLAIIKRDNDWISQEILDQLKKRSTSDAE